MSDDRVDLTVKSECDGKVMGTVSMPARIMARLGIDLPPAYELFRLSSSSEDESWKRPRQTLTRCWTF